MREYTDDNLDAVTMELRTTLDEFLTEMYECQPNEGRKEVTVSIAGYVAKTLSMRPRCIQRKDKLVFDDEDNKHDHGNDLQLLSRGDLIVSSLALTDFIFETFSILHFL